MSDRMRNLGVLIVAIAAIVVIVIGLWPGRGAAPDPAARAFALETRIKCPICAGEALAGSQSAVARDLRDYIETRIAEGASDQEITDEFVTNYGEQILLDPPRTGWGLWLWLIPIVVAGVGAFAAVRLRMRTQNRRAVAETPRSDVAGGS
jgi:cytochrome c-type biogenesis protein CcmH